MARLPDATALGSDIPNFNLSVVRERTGQEGEALADFGDKVSSAARAFQEQIDKTRTEDAYNKLSASMTRLKLDEKDGYIHRTGSNAVGKPLADEYEKKLQSEIDSISSGLSTSGQRQRFAEIAKRASVGFKADVLQHQMVETERFKDETRKATTYIEAQNAAENWSDPDRVSASRDRIIETHANEYRDDGIPPQLAEAKLLESLSNMHDGVIASAVNNKNVDYAKAYFAKYSGEMTDTARSQAKKLIEQGASDQKVLAAVDSAEKYLGAGPGMVPDEKSYMDKVRANLGKNASPQDIREASAEASRRFQDKIRSIRASEANAVTAAQQWLIDNGGNFNGMPASLKVRLKDYAPGQYATLQNQAAAIGNPPAKTDPAAENELYRKTDDELAETNLDEYTGKLSQQRREYWENRKNTLRAGGSGSSSYVSSVMRQVALDMYPMKNKDLNPAQLAQINEVRASIEADIVRARAKDAYISPDFVRKLADEHIMQWHAKNSKAEINGSGLLFDSHKALSDITYEEAKKINWGDSSLPKVPQIPQDIAGKIKAYGSAKGVSLSEDQISAIYGISILNLTTQQRQDLVESYINGLK